MLKPRGLSYGRYLLSESPGASMTEPQTRGLKQQTFIFSRSGGWKSEIRVPAWSVPSEDSLPGLQTATFLLCLPLAEKELQFLPLLRRTLMPSQCPTLRTQCLQKSPPPDTIILGIRASP